jgi:hypothetical protein
MFLMQKKNIFTRTKKHEVGKGRLIGERRVEIIN